MLACWSGFLWKAIIVVIDVARRPYVATCDFCCSFTGITSINRVYEKHMLLGEGHLFVANGNCLQCIQYARMEDGDVFNQGHLACVLLLCCV